MTRATLAFFRFNRGIVSRLGAARADVQRLALGAKTMTNWVTRALGSMNIRPGTKHLGAIYTGFACRYLEFVFSLSEKGLIELTANSMRIWWNDAVLTRPDVATTVTNGTFAANILGWTDNDESGAVSQWNASGYMELLGTGTTRAIRTQQVTVGAADIGVVHALDIKIARGPVTLRVGSTSGGDEYITATDLGEGYHNLAFTPAGDFYIQFESALPRVVYVDYCVVYDIVGPGTTHEVIIPAPWGASTTEDFNNIQYEQSGDVIFVACSGIQQYRIERRDNQSWSCVKYLANDGPFRNPNTTTLTMQPGALTGNTTMTASRPYFKTTNVGGLIAHTSAGQKVTASIAAADTFTGAIKITGAGEARRIWLNTTGVWVGTVTVQRSTESKDGPWVDVTQTGFSPTTANVTGQSLNDGFDNLETWYRVGIKTGEYTSGTVVPVLQCDAGNLMGVARITGFTNSQVVSVEVLKDFGSTAASRDWQEGVWSDRRGWPSAVCLAEGRLWWAGKDRLCGSVSDAYDSFDPETVGDSGPMNRTIGKGPVDFINWIASTLRLIMGGQGSEFCARTSNLDEILTPTNFNLKAVSTQGSCNVRPLVIDGRVLFVQRGGQRVFECGMDPTTGDFNSTHLTAVCPDLLGNGDRIVRAAFARQPEPRWFGVTLGGAVLVASYDKNENLISWSRFTTDGFFQDVAVLPSANAEVEDGIYFAVQRITSSGSSVRLERMHTEADCRPFAGYVQNSGLMDASVEFVDGDGPTLTGLDHLEGKQVCVWNDAADATYADDDTTFNYTVSGGSITLPSTVSLRARVGLPYTVEWVSTKLLQMPAQLGTPLNQYKRISNMGVVLADTHARGLQFGPYDGSDTLNDLPSEEKGAFVDADTIHTDYDEQEFPFPGDWDTDSRLRLVGKCPRPVTVVAVTCDAKLNE